MCSTALLLAMRSEVLLFLETKKIPDTVLDSAAPLGGLSVFVQSFSVLDA